MKILHTFPFTMKSAMRCFFLFFILHSSFFILNAQNVAINTTGASADPSAMLDVKSTTAGVLIPRMSTAQRNAISSPAVGLQIFNTDCDVLNYWTGTCWVSAGAIPSPDSISSSVSTILCAGATATYSIPAITGATAYYWQAPPGANITSGQGTTSINVTFSSASGNVCVTANDACETSQPTCRQVSVTAPITLGAISGITSSCASAVNVAYSVPVVTGATSYTWSVPSGSSIITGQGTNAITVTFGTTSGNISVYATNSCGSNSVTQTLPITLTGSVPATPGTITGATGVCNNVTSQNYTIFPVIGATSYTWSVPGGATITSGQGTTGITVMYTSNISIGNNIGTVSVYATNSCGNSVGSSQLTISGYLSQTAPGLIGGANLVAAGSAGNVYSIAPVSGGLYKWSITPSGPTITAGQGTTSITVTFGSSPASYAVCVYDSVSSNGCKSSASCLTVTSSTCPVHGAAIFSYTGALQNWQVPCSVTQVTAYLWGAGGGANAVGYYSAGGSGAFVGAVLNVTSISTLNIVVGQGALYNTSYTSTYGGGGGNSVNTNIGAGGGRSAIQFGGNGQDVLTAGGGGGAGRGNTQYYGNGGGGGNGTTASNGTTSASCTTDNGKGGTATAGGLGGTLCSGGTNGTAASSTQYTYLGASTGGSSSYGGAGGGGYYGGGSGAYDFGGGGGGGSSYPTSATGPVTGFISPTTSPVAGNTNTNAVGDYFIYPANYNVPPFSAYYISGVGTSAAYNPNYGTGGNGGNGEVVIIY